MFPEQEFFTLNQIASGWDVTLEKVQHVIIGGKLQAHLWVDKTLMHKVEPDSYTEKAVISAAIHIDGHIGLFANDCRKLFTRGKAVVRKFPADKSGCYRLIEHMPAIELDHGDIIITANEKSRFEREHKIGENSLPTFAYSNNFQEVRYDSYQFHFGKKQASIIAQLHEAAQTNNPWIYGKTLLKIADSKDMFLRNIFKNKRFWQKLICSDKKGYYRLNPDIQLKS